MAWQYVLKGSVEVLYWEDQESCQGRTRGMSRSFTNSAVFLDINSWSNSWDKIGFTEQQVCLAKKYRNRDDVCIMVTWWETWASMLCVWSKVDHLSSGKPATWGFLLLLYLLLTNTTAYNQFQITFNNLY